MDGVDLIICLAIWTLYKRCLPTLCDDFLAVSIASRNRLRSSPRFFVPRSILEGFREVFGDPNACRNAFPGGFFSDVFVRMRVGIDFGWICGHFHSRKPLKTIGLSTCFINFHKIDVCEAKVARY